jgi:hypothetical protein
VLRVLKEGEDHKGLKVRQTPKVLKELKVREVLLVDKVSKELKGRELRDQKDPKVLRAELLPELKELEDPKELKELLALRHLLVLL